MPLVTMTREMGSLGKDVAQGLADRLGRPVVYHEIIDHLADKMRLRKSHVIRFIEGKSNIWERLTTDKTSLAIFTADETLRLAEAGGVSVIRGWGAAHLLRPIPHVICVRVCAPLELRVRRMQERLGTDEREHMEEEIRLNEEAHGAITRRHFGIDWRDPQYYDLALNTERMSVDQCVDEVMSLIRDPRFRETPESIAKLRNVSLQTQVRAALRADPRTVKMNIIIEADDGKVTLSGVLERYLEPLHAEEVAAKVGGVKTIINKQRTALPPNYQQSF